MAALMFHGPLWKAAEQEPTRATRLRKAQRLWITLCEQDCSLYARNRVQGSS